EGPPAVPMRVLWDARDDANGRVTIDLGEKYEPALTKLGLPRVLAYDAKLDKSQFAVRDGEFARFVKVVATSIVQGFLTSSPVPGVGAQPGGVRFHPAAPLTTPAQERWEVRARLYVPYLWPKKSGPQKAQDLIRGDIVFVGQREPGGPGEATQPSKP